MALYRYFIGKGIYTDMNAIRRDEDELDNLHSIYVDQWDWEKVIEAAANVDYLKSTVLDIVGAICDTGHHPRPAPQLAEGEALGSVVHYCSGTGNIPHLTQGKENAYLKEHKTAFIMGIGGKLRSGKPHDLRSRTTTTGTSTATSSSGTTCWGAPWKYPQ